MKIVKRNLFNGHQIYWLRTPHPTYDMFVYGVEYHGSIPAYVCSYTDIGITTVCVI